MKNAFDIIQKPVITEKGSLMQAEQNKYLFRVVPSVTKKEIKFAIEKIYNVKVTSVRTVNVRGKMKRVRHEYGRTAAWKKAIVTLKKGDTIDLV